MLLTFFYPISDIISLVVEKIIKTAFEYILKNETDKQPRFDISEIIVDSRNKFKSINYFENAFDLEEYSEIF